jgi:hypothetical protein
MDAGPGSAGALPPSRLRRFLPAPGSIGYHALLATVALLILGPLGGITSAYMTFSLGFSVGGQVLAGILGSSVTYGYGAEGKHGANYIQTMAASVASMAGMGVLIQAMVWLGMPLPAPWKLGLYFGCVGMFGIGVGMLYTPILVDRLQRSRTSASCVVRSASWAAEPPAASRSARWSRGSPGLAAPASRPRRWGPASSSARASACRPS